MIRAVTSASFPGSGSGSTVLGLMLLLLRLLRLLLLLLPVVVRVGGVVQRSPESA